MRFYFISTLILSLILFNGCANQSNESVDNKNNQNKTVVNNTNNKENIRNSRPFYPMDETIEDIHNQISDLKSRVIEYESRINRIALDPHLLQMVKTPTISHEIELTNGTLVQGAILQEDIERIILKTQIGQIRIEKSDIVSIKENAPNSPNLKFKSEPEQKEFSDKRMFSGSIINEGMRRADFARVVFYLWDQNTDLIAADSSFVDGSSFQYRSGIVTDCVIESGATAPFSVTVSTPDTTHVRYITKEIHFSIYD